ncbi:MAG: hypothetical protein RPS99_03200, partial [Gammaproteobacteria bacterium]
EYEYNQFKIVDGSGIDKDWNFNVETQLFEADIEDNEGSEHQFYQLGTDGWSVAQESTPQVTSFSEDGTTLTIEFPGQGSRTVNAKEINLAEKELSSIAHLDDGWAKQMSASAIFPAESTMYSLKMEQLNDSYISPIFTCHETSNESGENCNNIWLEQNDNSAVSVDGRATELSALINSNWNGEDVSSLTKFHSMFGHDVMMAFVEQETETETLRYSLFFKHNDECYQESVTADEKVAECQPYEQVAKSTWREETINGQTALFITPPLGIEDRENDDEFNGKFLTEIDGFVRVGMSLSKGRIWREEFALNANAMEAVVQGFVTPDGTEDVAKEVCGIFEPKDDGENSDKEEVTDGTTKPPMNEEAHEDKIQGPTPDVISDAEKTALLSGSVYVMEQSQPDEHLLSQTIMIQFIDSKNVQVLINETFLHQTDEKESTEEEEYKEEKIELGEWTIDANNQLLMQFPHSEEHADGQVVEYTEWKLFKIEGEIGSAMTLTDQTDDKSADTFQLIQFDGLAIDSSTTQSIITIARADTDNCSLVLTF